MFSKPTPTSSSVPSPPGAAGSRRRSSHRPLRRRPPPRWLRSRCNARSPCDGSDRSATPPAGNGGLGGYGWMGQNPWKTPAIFTSSHSWDKMDVHPNKNGIFIGIDLYPYGWEDIRQEPTFLRGLASSALKITGIYG